MTQNKTDQKPGAWILVLDDEKSVRRVMVKMLEQQGYSVCQSASGEEAVECYTAEFNKGTPFNLVITDLTLPGGMGGLKAAEAIKKIDPKAKFIVASGYTSDPVIGDFDHYGFLGRIIKPYKIEELAEVVSDVLNK